MMRRRKNFGLDQPLRHPDHRRPVSRRDFIAQGFASRLNRRFIRRAGFEFLAGQLTLGQKRQGVLQANEDSPRMLGAGPLKLGSRSASQFPKLLAAIGGRVDRMQGIGPNQLHRQITLGHGGQLPVRQPIGAVPLGQFKQPPLAKALQKPLVLVGSAAERGLQEQGCDQGRSAKIGKVYSHSSILTARRKRS